MSSFVVKIDTHNSYGLTDFQEMSQAEVETMLRDALNAFLAVRSNPEEYVEKYYSFLKKTEDQERKVREVAKRVAQARCMRVCSAQIHRES